MCIQELTNETTQNILLKLFLLKNTQKEIEFSKQFFVRVNNIEVARQQLNSIIEYISEEKNEYISIECYDASDVTDDECTELKKKTFIQLNDILDEILAQVANHVSIFFKIDNNLVLSCNKGRFYKYYNKL